MFNSWVENFLVKLYLALVRTWPLLLGTRGLHKKQKSRLFLFFFSEIEIIKLLTEK